MNNKYIVVHWKPVLFELPNNHHIKVCYICNMREEARGDRRDHWSHREDPKQEEERTWSQFQQKEESQMEWRLCRLAGVGREVWHGD